MSDIDPYLALGPMHAAGDAPESPAPAAVSADTDDFDDDDEDLSLPLAAPPEKTDGAPEQDEPDDDDSDEEPTDHDWLIERARKADEYERYLAQQENARREAEATAEWDRKIDALNREYAERHQAIRENADQSLNPLPYYQTERDKLDHEMQVRYALLRDEREQALWQFAYQKSIPNHAARVVEHYKLPQEAINELLEYAPEQMEREAQKMRARLIKERTQQKEIDQLRRKADRRKLEANPLTTGAGRGAGGKAFAEMTDDERYMSIPWVRGR